MATTTNQGWTLPTVGGSEDTWGNTLNTTIQAIDTLVGAVSAAEFAVLDGITASTAELNILDGVTANASEINTLDGINTAGNFGLVPSGGVILWSGSTASIPSGWFLCDGNNGTPNLTDRFVVGAGAAYGVGVTGGSNNVTLTSANVPAHSHSFSGTTASGGSHTHTASTGTAGAHTHSVVDYGAAGDTYAYIRTSLTSSKITTNGVINSAGDHSHSVTINSGGAHTHTFSGTTGSYGSGTAFSILPKYYALAYIMKS